MTCLRCHGLMLEDQLLDMEASYSEMWVRAWRCVNCGHRDDIVIREHRQTQRELMRSSIGGVSNKGVGVSLESNAIEELAA